MPGPPGPASGRPEDKLDPGIHAATSAIGRMDRRVKPGDDSEIIAQRSFGRLPKSLEELAGQHCS